MKIGSDFYDSIQGSTLEEIEEIEAGPKGYQREHGFAIVEDADEPAVIMVPVFCLLCRSTRHPVPQYRFVSPYELARGRLEVADHMGCVRLDVVNQDLSEIVVGRVEDIAEEIRDNGGRLVASKLGGVLRNIVGATWGVAGKLVDLAARLPGLVKNAVDKI